ncbi:hypothetical protein C7E17_26645, partial [Stenotrophomonas maltophilia]
CAAAAGECSWAGGWCPVAAIWSKASSAQPGTGHAQLLADMLRGSCRGVQLGRRLVPGGSYLVESIIGAAWYRP